MANSGDPVYEGLAVFLLPLKSGSTLLGSFCSYRIRLVKKKTLISSDRAMLSLGTFLVVVS